MRKIISGFGVGFILLIFNLSFAEKPALINEKDGSEMIFIPEGEFTMGSSEGFSDEHPRHKVNLKSFYIDKYEINNVQYKKFVKETGHRIPKNRIDPRYEMWDNAGNFPPDTAQLPVTNICWDDAAAYAKWAGKRLPTEAEWEKAARGADQRRFPWGNEAPTEKTANFARTWQGFKTILNVSEGQNGASPYGVINMAGNVAEWVADYYDPHYYKITSGDNPQGPVSGDYRVIRGGGFPDPEFYLRTSDRDYDMPDDCFKGVGFRCVRDK
ncbi:MAG: formylglycine-generating enzyme family protein [Candidatus Schekmanbacteria bacterium]|nr:formylglycine-generating enzyme family protein [Candidatus Schekmanbacteria bacterium]